MAGTVARLVGVASAAALLVGISVRAQQPAPAPAPRRRTTSRSASGSRSTNFSASASAAPWRDRRRILQEHQGPERSSGRAAPADDGVHRRLARRPLRSLSRRRSAGWLRQGREETQRDRPADDADGQRDQHSRLRGTPEGGMCDMPSRQDAARANPTARDGNDAGRGSAGGAAARGAWRRSGRTASRDGTGPAGRRSRPTGRPRPRRGASSRRSRRAPSDRDDRSGRRQVRAGTGRPDRPRAGQDPGHEGHRDDA